MGKYLNVVFRLSPCLWTRNIKDTVSLYCTAKDPFINDIAYSSKATSRLSTFVHKPWIHFQLLQERCTVYIIRKSSARYLKKATLCTKLDTLIIKESIC
jgi:hypothetical protein